MATATPNMRDMRETRDTGRGARERTTPDTGRKTGNDTGKGSGLQQDAQKVQGKLAPLIAFLNKFNNDWVMNFASGLAYQFLFSIFPILLVILGIGSLIIGGLAPASQQTLQNNIANALPGGASGYGGQIVNAALKNLYHNTGVFFVLGIVFAIFSGSRIFVTLENYFGVIFRLRGRDVIHQNIMAILMMLLYVVLVPVVLLASIIPSAIVSALPTGTHSPVGDFLLRIAGIVAGALAAIVLFGAIYIVVPNRPVKIREVWKGTLVAAGLLTIYELIFPIYQSNFLKPSNYGALAGFAIVILTFFYYLGVILLLGAEVNSWTSGQRETAAPINAVLHEVQAHNTTRGAAGPTAGSPQEDLQNHEGAKAMSTTAAAIHHERDEHQGDMQPPKYAESGATGDGYRKEAGAVKTQDHALRQDGSFEEANGQPDQQQAERSQGAGGSRQLVGSGATTTTGAAVYEPHRYGALTRALPASRPLAPHQRNALLATVAASTVALAPAIRYVIHWFKDDE